MARWQLVVSAAALVMGGPVFGTACREQHATGSSAAPSASASASAATVSRCRPLSAGAGFRIGETGATGADGESRDLPFSTEIGPAVGYEGGFAVGALAATKTGTRAIIALVGLDGASGRVINLGPSYGSVSPPRIVARGSELYVVATSNDAAGGTLRLGVIRDPRGAPEVTWGAELSEGWDESQAFDVLVGKDRGVLVWDRWTKSKERSVVVGVSFDPLDVSSVSAPRCLSGDEQDSQDPRIVARPGGSWLAYLEHKPEDPGDAGVKSPTQALDEGMGTVVDLGRRVLMVAPLDASGKPIGEPRRVSAEAGHVVAFDLAPVADAALLLVWRDDPASPGVERGALHLAVMRPDGTMKHDVMQSDSLGSGAPSLIYDTAPGARQGVTWLAVGGIGDATQLTALDSSGKPLGDLRGEDALGRGDVLTGYRDGLLVGTPRGRSVEFSVVRCRPGTVREK